ncbi:MtrB/PioB family outer membrane beta-barrel protein [Dokdonella sp.]|uniref:MtrB/PioB family outer membrane beta-barrel protein n=1 Tax=Dokdonella sp. TaxID=2291710 RepID=UPI001B0E547B|nr:MtrB/PioB family outer membrane beta-barrel protein [Dokdonella sp.]MBO9662971.1 MtrB/PioB family outer membrane beta-barrel protein [Dokdonella sp.]
MACSSLAFADSGIGVDLWRGNKLDPTAGTRSETPDENGTTWLKPGQNRSPTGNLYLGPFTPPQPEQYGDWRGYGTLEVGVLMVPTGDQRNALWNRYADWKEGPILGLLDYTLERASDGTYANFRGSRISDDDEYYQATFGRAGAFKVQAFVRDMPNIVSGNAKPVWNGVGSNRLTLPSGLTPGGSTPAQIAAASAAAPERTLSVTREKQGLSYSMFLTPEWTAYANVTDEQRRGARPYGGSFFFPGLGGSMETVKPIDDSTINVNGGFRYAGAAWRMDFSYSGSFYRDANTRYTFESPFVMASPVPGALSAPVYQGQMSTEPDNDYHNLQATLTRKLPSLNGEVSLSAAAGRMQQDDTLIAPIDCRGVFGVGFGDLQLGPQNPLLGDCSQWNTPAALSRRSAKMRIDTSMVDARMVLNPTSQWTLRGNVKYDRQDYRTGDYLLYNPLTGQYGYIAENGSQPSIIPGEGFPVGRFTEVGNMRIRNIPLDIQTVDANLGADWKFDDKNTLGVTFGYNRYEPTHRERSEINDSSVKLTWINRSLDALTLRVNYTYLKQSGDRYDYDPYEEFVSASLPGYTPPAGGTPVITTSAMRKYDMSSFDQNKLDVMATLALRDDMTVSASARLDRKSYDARIGRQDYDTGSATLQWEWQPAATTNLSAFLGYDRSRLKMSNVNDALENGAGTDPSLGGPTYPYDAQWWLRDKQRNYYAGALFDHRIGRVRVDAGWNYTYSRGTDSYRYAGPDALAYPTTVPPGPGSGAFSPMVYRVNSFNLGVTIPIVERVSLRVFDYYERGRVDDWHYLGFDQSRYIGGMLYTDGGPQSYSNNVVGMLVNVKL